MPQTKKTRTLERAVCVPEGLIEFGGCMMTRSTWNFTSVSTLVLIGAGLFATNEVHAQEADPVGICKVVGESINLPEMNVTEMVCAYHCRSTRDQKFGQGVEPPTSYTCSWSGQNKTTPYLMQSSVVEDLIADSNAATSVSTPSNDLNASTTSSAGDNTVSLVSPTSYTNSAKDKISNKLAAKEKAFSSGGYTKSEIAKLMKLRKLDNKYNVGSRLDSMESKVSTMIGNEGYDGLVAALKNVQELELVLARDGKLTAAEAEKLNNSLMQLEARVGVAAGGGLQAKENLVRDRFQANKKHLNAAEIKQVQNQLAAFVSKKKEAEASVVCTAAIPPVCESPITDTERAQLLEMLQNTLEFIREKRDAKMTVEQVAKNNRAKIKNSAQQGLITAAQKNELLAEVNKAVKDYKEKKLTKAQAMAAIRKAGGEELIDEAVEKLEVNSCLKAGEQEIGGECYTAAEIKSRAAQVNAGKMACGFAGACEAGQKLVSLPQACIHSCEDSAVADSLNAWLSKIDLPSKCKTGEKEIGGQCWTLNKIREKVYFAKKDGLQCPMEARVCEAGQSVVKVPGTCNQSCVSEERAKNLNAWWAEFL
jgi:hypothetical protein